MDPFDLTQAIGEFTDAALHLATELGVLLTVGGNDEAFELARLRLNRAGGVVDWEIRRGTQAGTLPPEWDEEAVAELLAGARG